MSARVSLILNPLIDNERKSLRLLSENNEDEFTEQFDRLVLRFTDGTYDEIKKASHGRDGPM